MTRVFSCISGLRSTHLALLALVACTVGCGGGPETGSVKGTVTLGEDPFTDASLVLVSSESGQGASAELGPDGSFQLANELPVGTYTVYLTPKVDEEEMMKRMQEGKPPTSSKDNTVPKKYQNEVSSDLTVTVEPGENEVTLRMEK